MSFHDPRPKYQVPKVLFRSRVFRGRGTKIPRIHNIQSSMAEPFVPFLPAIAAIAFSTILRSREIKRSQAGWSGTPRHSAGWRIIDDSLALCLKRGLGGSKTSVGPQAAGRAGRAGRAGLLGQAEERCGLEAWNHRERARSIARA